MFSLHYQNILGQVEVYCLKLTNDFGINFELQKRISSTE